MSVIRHRGEEALRSCHDSAQWDSPGQGPSGSRSPEGCVVLCVSSSAKHPCGGRFVLLRRDTLWSLVCSVSKTLSSVVGDFCLFL